MVNTEDVRTVQRSEQLLLEEEMVTGGIAMYRERLNRLRRNGIETLTDPVQRVLKHLVIPVSDALRIWLDTMLKRPGRRAVSVPYLKECDPDVAALLGLRVVLDEATAERRYQAVAHTIGAAIQNELHFEAFARQKPQLFNAVDRHVEESPLAFRPGYREKVLKHATTLYGVVWQKWPNEIIVHVGGAVLDIIVQKTDLITVERITTNRVTDEKLVVIPTKEMLNWLEREHNACEALSPLRMPMVCPPGKHTTYRGGGYLTKPMQKPVVRTWQTAVRGEFSEDRMPVPFAAINILQAVPYEVDGWVLDVIQHKWDHHQDIPKICRREDIPLPVKPTLHSSECRCHPCSKARKLYKQRSRDVYYKNLGERGRRLATAQTLTLAKRFRGRPIWFPMFFDFRGRVYSHTQFLNPQGSDLAKGLLRFHRSMIVTATGLRWLKIHTANCFGIDKVSFDDRIKWIEEHVRDIHAVADDPLGTDWWHKADSPIQFLAACRELSGALRHPLGTFHSSLICMVDGTCNGVQHLAALSRDSTAGGRVNLLPADKPQDLYSDVKAAAIELLKADNTELGRMWLEYDVDRPLCKRPTMIVPYGGTLSAFRTYVEFEIDEREKNGRPHPFGLERKAAISYMASILWKSVALVLSGPRYLQQWTRQLAAAVNKTGNPLRWTSPSGFPILQGYPKTEVHRIKTKIGGKRAGLILREFTDKLDPRKQSQSLAPNMTHGYDAAVLHLHTVECQAQGLEDLATNHDCFGAHCEVMGIVGSANREVFVRVYSQDPLGKFIEDISQWCPGVELPERPPMGDLDINGVLDSPYFCA